MAKKVFLILALFCAVVQGAWAQNTEVRYMERSWDGSKVVGTEKTITNYTILEGSHPEDWIGLTDGYYVVAGNAKYKVLNILGSDVHLILGDNSTLAVNHIKLEGTRKLSIYCQTSGAKEGVLDVENHDGGWNPNSLYSDAAAIGSGGEGVNMGSLYVHGGKIKAYTGVRGKGAGIGGGNKSSIGGEVVIYEGLIQTKSETYGAGLGGGKGGNQGGSITIYSGTVKAIGGTYAAGIGGGDEASGGKVTIYGGWVECTSSSHGAGIGGSDGGDGGQVSILGGIVTCYGGLYNSWFVAHKQPAIGGGSDGGPGELTLGNNMKVLASEDHYSDTPMFVYTNAERIAACRSNRLARISTCDHTAQNGDAPSMVITYSIDDAESHTKHCRYCNTTETVNHTFVDNICNKCGKAEDTNDDLYDVTLYRATAAGTYQYAERLVMKVVKGKPFVVPAVNATEGLTLMGYTTTWSLGDGIEMKDDETLTAVGTEVTPEADMNYYPRYRYRYVPTWTWNDDDATATLTIKCNALSSEDISVNNITYTNNDDNTKTATGTYEHYGATYTFTDTYTPPVDYLSLYDASSNNEALDTYKGRKVKTLMLVGRTLYADGSWNTLCLPFDLSTEELAMLLSPSDLKILRSTSFNDGTLTLNFADATFIEAGKPYLIRWTSGTDRTNPIFDDITFSVSQDGTETTDATQYVDFVGAFAPVSLQANDKTVLYLGDGNNLYYPTADMTIRSCRAVFRLKGITAGDLPVPGQANAHRFVLNFGDDESTSINEEFRMKNEESDGVWYDLQGRKFNGKPTQNGIYINNGKKRVVK